MSLAGDQPCQEIVEVVTDYLEGAMPPLERARFEQHLNICDGCATYLEQMRATIRLTGRRPTEESLTPAAKAAFLTAFRSWKRRGGAAS